MSEYVTREILNQELAVFFGQLTRHFDRRFAVIEKQLNTSINILATQTDSIVKILETHEHEPAAMGNQLDRHQSWIGQLAEHTETELKPNLLL